MRLALLCVCSTSLWPAAGQSPTWASASRDASGGLQHVVRFTFDPKPFETRPVPGAPYSAEEITSGTQVSSEGTREERQLLSRKLFRDSQGRVRCERPLFLGPNIPEPIQIVEITDYVAGYHYTLDPQSKIAHRTARPSAPPPDIALPTPDSAVATIDSGGSVHVDDARLAKRAAPPNADPPAVLAATLPPDKAHAVGPEKDPLGTRVIEGVTAVGMGFTKTIATSSGGDSRQLMIRWENWTSPELSIVILSKVSDGLNGERMIRIRNISRSEPDTSLFQVPPDYTIQNENGAFSITFSGKQ